MISFIHLLGANVASYRYRAQIPAIQIGATLNNFSADVLVFAKPMPGDDKVMQNLREEQHVIMDICDNWLYRGYYRRMMSMADVITCPTGVMGDMLAREGRSAVVIPDPYEFPEQEPHCAGKNLLWFGHGSNLDDLRAVKNELHGCKLRIVSNAHNTIPWSMETIHQELESADIVIIPAYAPYKSANRALEAIRSGCYVVAEPHPSLEDIPGIWKGDLRSGIEWAAKNCDEANRRTWKAQKHIKENFSPERVGNAWRTVCEESESSSEAVISRGVAG